MTISESDREATEDPDTEPQSEESEPGVMDILESAGEKQHDGSNTAEQHSMPACSYEVAVTGSRFDYLQRSSWPEQSMGREESVEIAQNPSRWRAAPAWAVVLTGIGATLILGFIHLLGFTPELLNSIVTFWEVTTVPNWYIPLLLIPGLFGGTVLLAEATTRAFTWNVVTEYQVFVRTGILNEWVEDVPLHEINKLELEKAFPLRLVGVGHIYVYTPGTDDCEIELRYLKNPDKVKEAIKGRAANVETPP